MSGEPPEVDSRVVQLANEFNKKMMAEKKYTIFFTQPGPDDIKVISAKDLKKIDQHLQTHSVVCIQEKVSGIWSKYQAHVGGYTFIARCEQGKQDEKTSGVIRYSYDELQLREDLQRLPMREHILVIDEHNYQQSCGGNLSETLQCVVISQAHKFADIIQYLKQLHAAMNSIALRAIVVILNFDNIENIRSYAPLLGKKYELLTQTTDLDAILELNFTSQLKLNIYSRQLPSAVVLQPIVAQGVPTMEQIDRQSYSGIINKIIAQKNQIIQNQNYCEKVSSELYIYGPQESSGLVQYMQMQYNKQEVHQMCHCISDLRQLGELNRQIMLIAVRVEADAAKQITSEHPNIKFFAWVRKLGARSFSIPSYTEVYSDRLLSIYRCDRNNNEHPHEPKSNDIRANKQFQTLFTMCFDYESKETNNFNGMRIPPFAQKLSQKHRQFVHQFIAYLHVFYKFDQDKLTSLLEAHRRSTDKEIYEFLRTLSGNMFEHRYELRTNQLRKFLNRTSNILHEKVHSLLDIGCADGVLAEQTAEMLGVDPLNTYGVDIRNIVLHPEKINYIQCDLELESIQLPPGSLGVVTCTQVLHHIKNWRNVIKTVAQVLRPDGYFIIRESFMESKLNQIMLDIQHGLYACVLNNEMTIDDYINNFETNYLMKEELMAELKRHLVVKHILFDGKDDKFQKCWILCGKQRTAPTIKLCE